MFEALGDLIKSMYPNENPVPLHAPRFSAKDKEYLLECVDSTFVSYMGPFVKKFESQLAVYSGAKFAIATNSGTSALHLALLVSGVQPGDEVVVPALTFVATANAVSYCGAACVLVDVDRDSLGICPNKLENFLRKNSYLDEKGECRNRATKRKIAACIPVHVLGHPAKMAQINEICERYRIQVVEDACEALGSFEGDLACGTLARIGVLSFNGNKILTTGGGGMILTNDPDLAKKALHLSTTAKLPHAYKFVHDQVAYNYRLPSLNAALGCAQFERLARAVDNKRETADIYRRFFAKFDFRMIEERPGTKANYWLNAVSLQDVDKRDALLEFGINNGIQMRPLWDGMQTLAMYKDCQKDNLDVAEDLIGKTVCLPSSVRLGSSNV